MNNKLAYVTFLMRNDSFLPGALVFAYGLRKQNTKADIVCLITKDISDVAIKALRIIFDEVILVDEIYIEHKRRHERQDRPFLFTRFNALRLGQCGDLGYNYEKVVVVDSDIIPIRNYDELFSLKAPAGIVNEKKEFTMEYDDNLQYTNKNSFEWKWHSIYNDICPHGTYIPKNITDRVISDETNMGVNACLWVLTPSMSEFKNLLDSANEEENYKLISEKFNWPEMQYATMYFSGRWTNIDLRYASFKGYPNLNVLYGTHFSGVKPWNFKKEKTLKRFKRYDDYKLFYDSYIDMVTKDYSEFLEIPKLKRLYNNIINLNKT